MALASCLNLTRVRLCGGNLLLCSEAMLLGSLVLRSLAYSRTRIADRMAKGWRLTEVMRTMPAGIIETETP